MNKQYDGLVYDISQDGISIISAERIICEFVELRINDLFDISLEMDGRIIHCEKMSGGSYRAGVKLLGTVDENKMFHGHILHRYSDSPKNLRVNIAGFLSQ